uniref:Uncharacterized protein n=1 Tax=Rhizophagus irregularis (strain DAOM 181602 / DAOM 197198 / MUCL 43194) TaxID=747089 RepID=U9SWM3_RHIID
MQLNITSLIPNLKINLTRNSKLSETDEIRKLIFFLLIPRRVLEKGPTTYVTLLKN